ncbi:MAG: hypothetical protein ACM3KR_04115 [Deltaproteobacteria bacterium]
MYCQFCGTQLEGKPKFCEKCGKSTADTEMQSTNQAGYMPADPKNNMGMQPQMTKQKEMKQPANKAKSGMSAGQSIIFWITWSVLAVMSVGMMLYEFSAIQAGAFVILLFILLLLRKKLFGKVLSSIAGWSGAFLIFLVIVGLMGNIDPQRNKEIGEIQSAFEQKDVAKVAGYLHPENSTHMKAIFEKHQGELDKVGKLISTKRLIYADANYAEYEVKDNGKKYIMIFEKVEGKWRLSRF